MSIYGISLEKFHTSLAPNIPLKYVHYLTSPHKRSVYQMAYLMFAQHVFISSHSYNTDIKLYLVELASYNDMTRITDVNSTIIQNYIWKWKTWNALISDLPLRSISFTSDCNKARSESWTIQCWFCIKINQTVTLTQENWTHSTY